MVNELDMKMRTKRFSLDVIRLVTQLPKTVEARAIGNQLGRSGTSVGVNYRAACRGKSKADFIAKFGIVEEEADETCYWLEIIIDGNILPQTEVHSLLKEANELTAIVVSSRKTAKGTQ